MKGTPAEPGGPLTSKPTWFSTFWVPSHVGFFLVSGGVDGREDQKGESSMKLLQTLLWLSAGVAGLGLLGCELNVGRSHPEPVYVEQPPPQPEYVIVREAPPAVIVERRSPPPSREHLWIEGYWHWNSRQYVWQAGHWDRPPREHFVWVAPRYERHEQGYRYTPGQWREEGKGRDGDREQRRDGH